MDGMTAEKGDLRVSIQHKTITTIVKQTPKNWGFCLFARAATLHV
jgi:hypothetical protein